MKMTLTKKTLLPIGVIGILLLIVFTYLQWLDQQHQASLARTEALLALRESTQRFASQVKSGILTRDDSYAIAAANTALLTAESLERSAANGTMKTELAKLYQDYVAAVVGIGSVFLENRQAEGRSRMSALV